MRRALAVILLFSTACGVHTKGGRTTTEYLDGAGLVEKRVTEDRSERHLMAFESYKVEPDTSGGLKVLAAPNTEAIGIVAGAAAFTWVNSIWAAAIHGLRRASQRGKTQRTEAREETKQQAIGEAGDQGVVLAPPGLTPVPKPAPEAP